MLGRIKQWLGGGRDGEETIDGVRVRIDRGPMVLAIDAPPDIDLPDFSKPLGHGAPQRVEPELLARPPVGAAGRGLVSAAVLAHKAKQVDDGIYAAVELAADAGAGTLRGKGALLAGLVQRLASAPPGPAVATVLGAASIGAPGTRIPEALAEAVRVAVARFEQDPLASKPLGFYTWSPDLGRIFRRDRLLQQELEGAAGISAIVEALRRHPDLAVGYLKHLDLAARLTNALVPDTPDLHGFLLEPEQATPSRGVHFFPPSRSHETDLVKRMYGDSPIPDGFSLVDEMLRRLRAGTLDLAPPDTAGWYDWQTFALETLAAPHRAPEAKKLRVSPAYQNWLGDLFRSLLALTRETHVKQLELPVPGAAMPMPRREITIRPNLRVEPLPTFYLRRALAYQFVRGVLEEAFGAEALSDVRGLRADGPVKAPLADELRDVEALFFGAYAASMADLGLPLDAYPPAAAALPAFLAWREGIANDPDLWADARMMVPLFYDRGRRKTKALVFLGWTERRLLAHFETRPHVEVLDQGVDVVFEAQSAKVAYPVTAEVYVSRILDRAEMRALCDEERTRSAILAALEG